MGIKLIITKKNDPEFKSQREFDHDVITIGRDSSNILHLPDEYKVVGRSHAKIERTTDGYQLIDLGSKNFTLLNEKTINAGQAYPITHDSQIKCGDYILTFYIQDKVQEQTVFSPETFNPFREDTNELGKILSRIYETYALESSSRRKESLKYALHQALNRVTSNEAGLIMAAYLQSGGDFSGAANRKVPLQNQKPEGGESLNQTLNILLEYAVKMIHGHFDFRIGFLEETYMKPKTKSPDFLDLYSCSAEEMKNYLVNEQLTEEEASERQTFVKQALNDLLRHQIAILEGYKKCVKKGTQHFLQRISPHILKKELMERKLKLGPLELSFRTFPFLFKIKFYQIYEQKHKELINDDESFVEKKVYRPGFIEGYRNFMDSGK